MMSRLRDRIAATIDCCASYYVSIIECNVYTYTPVPSPAELHQLSNSFAAVHWEEEDLGRAEILQLTTQFR
jgi:hypothetical protein